MKVQLLFARLLILICLLASLQGQPARALSMENIALLRGEILASQPGLAPTAAGDLDLTFDGDGKASTDFGEGKTGVLMQDRGKALAVQPDGKIIVAGSVDDLYSSYIGYSGGVARFNVNGTLDTGFTGGRVGFAGNADAVVIQPDGKILVAGTTYNYSKGWDFVLERYDIYGDMENITITDFAGEDDRGHAVAFKNNGEVVVAGSADVGLGDDLALVFYTASSIYATRKVTTDFASSDDSANAIALQPDGKIVVAGYADIGDSTGFAVARYLANGDLDTSFGEGGKVTTSFPSGEAIGNAVIIQPDGKILVAGSVSEPGTDNDDFALARYNEDGLLDTSFGVDGTLTTDFAGPSDTGQGIALQSDGKILVAGCTQDIGLGMSSGDIALARYDSSGVLDASFSGDGKLTTDFFNDLTNCANAIAIHGEKIIVAGYAWVNTPEHFSIDFAVVRYENDATSAAASVIVNTTSDVNNGDTSSVSALGLNPGPDGKISLREAILATNNTPSHDTILFNIPGNGVQTIQPATPLPALTGGGDTLDGYTQPGSQPATATTPATLMIEIDGSNAGYDHGLRLNSIGITIRGLIINRFPWNGIAILSGSDNLVAGNYIGLDATGSVDQGNGYHGVYISSRNNTVGGDEPAERNIISGNNLSGIGIYGATTMSNTISGNYIGLDAAGTAALGNSLHGVRIATSAHDNIIGPGNIIAYNTGNGVTINDTTTIHNIVTQNSIFANNGVGIDLVDGANGETAAPSITKIAHGSVLISGTACSGCTVEVFASPDTDGEGQVYLGSDAAEGGDFVVAATSLPYSYLTATATDPISGTSEFSTVFTATLPALGSSTKEVDQATANPGEVLTYTITLNNTGLAAATVTLTDVLPAEVTWLDHYTISGGELTWNDANKRLVWSGVVGIGASVTIVYQAKIDAVLSESTIISNTATLDDGAGGLTEIGPATTTVDIPIPACTIYLPLVAR